MQLTKVAISQSCNHILKVVSYMITIIIIIIPAYLLVVKILLLDTSVVEYTKTFNTIVANEKIAVPMP